MSKHSQFNNRHFPFVGLVVEGHARTLPAYRRYENEVAINLDKHFSITNILHNKQSNTCSVLAPRFTARFLSKDFFQNTFNSSKFSLSRNDNIGYVEHVIGRDGENYIGRGSTDQSIASLNIEGKFSVRGLELQVWGVLDQEKNPRGEQVVPELVSKSYDIAIKPDWDALRFLLDAQFVEMMRTRIGE